MTLPSAIPDADWSVSFARESRLRSELYFDNDDRGTYAKLKAARDVFETAAGGEVTWEDLPEKKASRIALYRSGEIELAGEYHAYIDWFIESQERLRKGADAVPTAALSPGH